ncbi:hypothetical protein [Vagococcus sp. WN89Y]|uniref:hypothetical protein n=1 Tax=Vagococcus sp. WN89Y TaxID=3457258 RepID=UPI003FCC4472
MTTIYTPFIDVTINAEWSDWQNYPNGRPSPLYFTQAIDWNVEGLVFGFITLAASTNTPCWGAQPTMPLDWAKPLADSLNAEGKKVVISFGGAANMDISYNFTVDELVNTYESTITIYDAAGLDFDLENGLYDIDKICEALVTIQEEYPDVTLSFTLPTLPTGLTNTGLGVVSKAVDADLDFVINGMAMDYYDANYALNMGQAAADAATSIATQLQRYYPNASIEELYTKTAITPMIGLNDDLSIFTLADASLVGDFAAQNDLAFLGWWDFNRDNPSKYTYTDLTTSSNPEQTVSGEYAQNFVS